MAQHTEAPANPHTPPTPALNGATKTAPRGKHLHEADDAIMVDLEQRAQAKRVRTTTSNSKHQHEVDDTTSAETELAAPTKKTRIAPKKMTTAPKKNGDTKISPQWSNQTQANVLATPQRRKR